MIPRFAGTLLIQLRDLIIDHALEPLGQPLFSIEEKRG